MRTGDLCISSHLLRQSISLKLMFTSWRTASQLTVSQTHPIVLDFLHAAGVSIGSSRHQGRLLADSTICPDPVHGISKFLVFSYSDTFVHSDISFWGKTLLLFPHSMCTPSYPLQFLVLVFYFRLYSYISYFSPHSSLYLSHFVFEVCHIIGALFLTFHFLFNF